jgi:hypothetical protein
MMGFRIELDNDALRLYASFAIAHGTTLSEGGSEVIL